jgi:hypothetical protein
MAKGGRLPAPLTPTPDLGFMRKVEQGGVPHGEATYAAFLQNAGLFFRVYSQSCTLGWYAMPLKGMGSGTRLALKQSAECESECVTPT